MRYGDNDLGWSQE